MPSDAERFWGAITERANPEDCSEGDLIYMETKARGCFYRAISEIWTDGHGIKQARLREPTPEELDALEAGGRHALVWIEEMP